MLKINSNLKYKDLPLYVHQHLMFHEPNHIKFIVSAFTFILLDLSLILLLYPFIKIFYILAVPLYLLVHIWAVRLLIKNPYTTQFESILFLGIVSAVTAIIYTLLAVKISYFDMEITSPLYYIFLSIGFLVIFFILIRHQIGKYYNITKKSKQEQKVSSLEKYGAVLGGFPALGYLIAQATKDNEIIMYSFLLLISIGFASFGAYMGAKQIHKYFFMKANPQFVGFKKPSKKERREFEEKGIVYK